MYQKCCRKCGSENVFTKVSGTNTGLYCKDCGAWITWLGKDDLNALNEAKRVKEVNNITQEIYMSDDYKSLEERKVKALEKIADCLEEYLSSGLPVRQ